MIVLAAPLVGAGAFGLVEPWSRWIFLLIATAAASILRPGLSVVSSVLIATGLIALLQSAFSAPPDSPSGFFTSASSVASMDAAATWLSAGLLSAVVTELREGDADFLRRLAYALVATAVIVSVIGLLQMADGNTAIYGWRIVMSAVYPFAGFYNRNHAACFIGIAMVLGAGLYCEQLPVSSRIDAVAKRITLASPLLLLGGAIWATESRAAIAAVAAAFMSIRRPTRAFIIVAVLGAGALAVFRSSLIQRWDIYRSVWTVVCDRWLFGWGAGAFMSASPAFTIRGLGGVLPHAHSSWLDLMFDFGIPFSLFLLAGAGCIIGSALRSAQGLIRFFAAAAAFVFLHSAVESSMFAGVNLATFGMCLGTLPMARYRSAAHSPVAVACGVSLVCMTLLGPRAFDSFRRLSSEAYYAKDVVADDIRGNPDSRTILVRYRDAGREVWDARRSALRARALQDLGRSRDSEFERMRYSVLAGAP